MCWTVPDLLARRKGFNIRQNYKIPLNEDGETGGSKAEPCQLKRGSNINTLTVEPISFCRCYCCCCLLDIADSQSRPFRDRKSTEATPLLREAPAPPTPTRCASSPPSPSSSTPRASMPLSWTTAWPNATRRSMTRN